MKKIFAILLVTVFASSVLLASAAGAMDIYTFKKDRVDQKLDGNRGYITGPPPAPEDRTGIKRTLIGVDIELYSGGTEEGEEGGTAEEKRPAKPVKKAAPEAPKKAKTVVVEQETYQEEWIK